MQYVALYCIIHIIPYHIYIYIYKHTYIYTRAHTRIRINIYTRIHICVYIYIHIYIFMYVYMHRNRIWHFSQIFLATICHRLALKMLIANAVEDSKSEE